MSVRSWMEAENEQLRAEVERLRARVSELVKLLDDQYGTPCEQIRHQQEVERLHRDLEIWKRNGGDILLRAEVERLRAERDEWKAKWMSLAAASLVAGTMTLEQKADR